MFDEIKTERFKKIISSLILVVSHLTITQIAYYCSLPKINETDYDGIRHIIVTLIVSLGFYYFFVRTQVIFNSDLRKNYYASKIYPKRTKFLLTKIDLWLDISIFAIVFIAFDINKTYPIVTAIPQLFDIVYFFDKCKVLCLILPIFICVNIFARYNAVDYWFSMNQNSNLQIQNPSLGNDAMAKNASKLVPTSPVFSAMRFLSRTYSVNSSYNPELIDIDNMDESAFELNKKLRTFVVIFAISIALAISNRFLYRMLTVFIIPFFKEIIILKVIIIVATIIIVSFVYKKIKSIFKRYAFINKLKKLSANNNIDISKVKCPYSSLFSFKHGENFRITLDGKSYSCKFISCTNASVPLIFNEDGVAILIHSLTFAGIKWFEYSTKIEYDYESDVSQILIVNPSPKFTYAMVNKTIREVDNGDGIGKYKIYTGNSFINSAERNCLHK